MLGRRSAETQAVIKLDAADNPYNIRQVAKRTSASLLEVIYGFINQAPTKVKTKFLTLIDILLVNCLLADII